MFARIRVVLRNREVFAQIAVRESRLDLAEKLNEDIKNSLADFVGSIDDLDSAIARADKDTLPRLLGLITEKTQKVRKHIAELDARLEKTVTEWEDLKKNEIGLSVLESQSRNFHHQEKE